MAAKPHARACSTTLLKVALMVIALFIAGYILGPPLYWHLKEGFAAYRRSSSTSCPPCKCDCSSQPLLSIPQDLTNTSFTNCAKNRSEEGQDTVRNFAELLKEELELREVESSENQKRSDMALLEAKKVASQYQKEADKCNSGMETCEEARERSETILVTQKKLTTIWELRARERGWKEDVVDFHAQF